MEGRHVDVTIISAENLKKVNLIGKMRTYAWVWIDPAFRQATAVDERGGANPTWDQQLSFPVPERFFQQPHARLTVEIYSKAAFFDDKFVGAASVPVSEIVQKASAEEATTHEVRRRSGEVKGSLRISVRAGEKAAIGTGLAPPYPHEQRPCDANGYPPPPAYGHGHYQPPPPSYQHEVAYGQGHYQPPPQPPYPPEAAYGQGYYQQPPPYYQAQPPAQKRPGMGGMGMGLGAGLLAGAAGGLIVGDLVDDAFDGDDGGF